MWRNVTLNCSLLGSRTRSCGSERRKILRSLWKIPKKRNPKRCWSNMFKNSQIYIVLTPEFEGYFNGKSLPAYGRMGKVRIEKKNEKNELLKIFFYTFFRFSWLMKLVLTSSWSKYKSSRQTIAFKNLWKCLLMWCLLLMRQQQIFVIAVYDEH